MVNRINKTAAQKFIIIFIFSPILNFSQIFRSIRQRWESAFEPHVKTWKNADSEKVIFSLKSFRFYKIKQFLKFCAVFLCS